MAKVLLSHAAERALQEIYIYTYDRFGEAQADAYHEAFHRSFGSADEIRPGLRRLPQGKHLLFYSVSGDGDVLIERIFHGAQNIRRDLFDD